MRSPLGLGSAALLAACSQAQTSVQSDVTLRDRFWLYGQEAGAQNGRYGLPGNSYITAAEAAHYLSVPNLIFGWCHPARQPDSLPQYRQLAIPFRPFKRVVWSIVGCSGKTKSDD